MEPSTLYYLIFAIIFIGVVLFLTCQKFKRYISRHWDNLFINFSFILIAAVLAIWGVDWLIRENSKRNMRSEIALITNCVLM